MTTTLSPICFPPSIFHVYATSAFNLKSVRLCTQTLRKATDWKKRLKLGWKADRAWDFGGCNHSPTLVVVCPIIPWRKRPNSEVLRISISTSLLRLPRHLLLLSISAIVPRGATRTKTSDAYSYSLPDHETPSLDSRYSNLLPRSRSLGDN